MTEKPEEPKSFWGLLFYSMGSVGSNTSGIFERRPSSLHPLDGLRAIAIIWVFILHLDLFWAKYFFVSFTNPLFVKISFNGDLGVDIFFVLSGFLIAYILLKECEKYGGNIDVFNFLRSRFLRLWPALLILEIITYIHDGFKVAFLPLIFINNFWNKMQHQWSVAVEFQFYIISPWIVGWMYKAKPSNVWVAPITLFVLSTICNAVVIYITCPQALNTASVFYDKDDCKELKIDSAECEKCGEVYWMQVYQKMYTRASPYAFGMWAAYCHLKELKERQQNDNSSTLNYFSTIFKEFLAFISLVFVTIFGCFPSRKFDLIFNYPKLFLAWTIISRQIFGASLAYLILLMVSPYADSLQWYRPSRWLRSALSAHFWVPIATLSYSIYLFHIEVLCWAMKIPYFNPMPEDNQKVTACPWDPIGLAKVYMSLNAFSIVVAIILAFFAYIIIEKPFIDARKAFVNSYELIQEKTPKDEEEGEKLLKEEEKQQ